MATIHFLIGITNALFALVIVIAFLYSLWALAFYVWEMGSEEGKREYKGMLLNSTTAFALLIIAYAIIASFLPIEASAQTNIVTNPLAVNSFCALFLSLYNGLLILLIPCAVLALVICGCLFVLALGNAEKLLFAQKALQWTVIGIAIFLVAPLAMQLLISTVNQLMNTSILSCQ
jgi:hypothetical protein